MKTTRMGRIDSQIQKELSMIISRFDDVKITSTIFSITKVDTTSDLSYAKVYVSIFGDDDKKKEFIKKLKDNQKTLRYELAHAIRLKKIPELNFLLDDIEEKAEKINKLFDQIKVENSDEE